MNLIGLDSTILFNVNKYIKENKSIILTGFVSFRLKNYVLELDELIESAVNKFLIDKEYLEFVSLLKIICRFKDSKSRYRKLNICE